ncbi:MAG: GNAT family N-acetyltransferase [Pseudomonadota bacterium]
MDSRRLHTQRLTLTPVSTRDSQFFIELMNSPGWLEFIGDRNIQTVDDAREQIETVYARSFETHGFGYHVISDRSDGLRLGVCGILKRDNMPNPDLGFAMLPAGQGQGFAYEACERLLRFVHATNAVTQLDAITRIDNLRSISLLERLHFRRKHTENDGDETLAHFYWDSTAFDHASTSFETE